MSTPRAKKRIAPNPLLDDRKVEQIPIGALQPPESNARTHSQRHVRQIARSINRFGFINPVLVDRNNRIIAGVGRVAGARLAGHTTVPTIRIEHLSDEEKRAYVIADNRLAEKAGWDRDILAIELKGLIDLHFDVELTGFEISEIEMMFDAVDPAANNPEDDLVPDLAPDRVVT
jgi:ParB-like chromosome segregation protein Spo0J